MTTEEKLMAVGFPAQQAIEIAKLVGGGSEADALRRRIEALELIVSGAIVTDEAP